MFVIGNLLLALAWVLEFVFQALSIILKPIARGWAVCLTDGRELARFRGPGARTRAARYLRAQLVSTGRPA